MPQVTLSFLRGALRPAPWPLLIGSLLLWAVLLRLVGPGTGPRTWFLLIQGSGLISGLGAAFLTSADVDPPWTVIALTPRAPFVIRALRWLIWLLAGLAVFLVVGTTVTAAADQPELVEGLTVTWVAYSAFALSSTLTGALADLGGAIAGTIASLVLITVAAVALPRPHRPIVEIEYLHAASHWTIQAAVAIAALCVPLTRARRQPASPLLRSHGV